MPSAWIVPKNNRSVLVRISDEHGYRDGAPPLVDIGPVPMPPLAPHVLDPGADTLVYFDKHLRVVRSPGREQAVSRDVRLAWSLEIHALLLHDGVVYAGGGSGSEVLGFVDLRGDLRWQSIDVPRDVLTFGKGIDGFALRGRTLVAVDDIVLPRYHLLYDVTDARSPRFLEARELPAHSSYERIASVASNDRALALLSTTANHGHFGVHVSLIDLATLEERAVLHASGRGSLRRGAGPVVDFSAVALTEKTLLVAAGKAGIAALPLDPWLRDTGEPRVIPFEALRFVPAGEAPVVGVSPVSEQRAFAICSARQGLLSRARLDSTLVRLD